MLDESLISTCHYHCAFQLTAKDNRAPWHTVAGSIKRWLISQRNFNPKIFAKPWFFCGGNFPEASERPIMQVAVEVGNSIWASPQYWAIRLEQPDGLNGARIWRTDIAITRQAEKRLTVRATVTHRILPRHVGDEPPLPTVNTPSFVKGLLKLQHWEAMSGSEKLTNEPIRFSENDAGSVIARIADEKREAPIVVVSCDNISDAPLVKLAALQKACGGVANVYVSSSRNTDRAFDDLAGAGYRCSNGMIRVYWPSVRFLSATDAQRHRFIKAHDIKAKGESWTCCILRQALQRNSIIENARSVGTVDDVRFKSRIGAAKLREQVGTSNPDQVILDQILEDALKYCQNKDAESKQFQELALEAQMREELTSIELRDAIDESNRLAANHEKAQNEKKQLAERVANLLQGNSNLKQLPKTAVEVVEITEKLAAGRLVFTAAAKKDAQATCDGKLKSLCRLWGALRAMADLLLPMMRERNNLPNAKTNSLNDILNFKAKSDEYWSGGFDIAWTEGGQTKSDAKNRRIREIEWENQKLDITPHLKIDDDKPHRRAYFAYDQRKGGRLIIGGLRHLPTAGSRLVG